MDWIMVVSIILNIVLIASYLKVPEFLQSFFIKRIDHNFNERMIEIKYEQEKELDRIQSEFQKERQKMEHDFQVNLDTMKRKKEILPELYKKIMIAFSHYVYSGNDDRGNRKEFAKNGLYYLAELRNFLTFNKFFMNQPIYNKAKEFDEISKKLIAIEHPEYQSVRDDIPQMTIEESDAKREEIHEQLKTIVEKLDEFIYDELNS